MRQRRGCGTLLGGALALGLLSVLPASAQAFASDSELTSSSQLQATFKQSEQQTALISARIDAVFRQTVQRLAELARQDLTIFETQRVYLDSAAGEWPIALYVQDGDALIVKPSQEKLLTRDELDSIKGRSSWVGVNAKRQSVVVAVPASRGALLAASIPLSVFTAPIEGMSVGSEGRFALLDAQGRMLGGKGLDAGDSELLGSVASETRATLVSRESLLASARVPSSDWRVVLRLPLSDVHRGVVMPPLDDRAFASPWYVTKREAGLPDDLMRNVLLSLMGVALIPLSMVVAGRRFREPLMERAKGLAAFAATLPRSSVSQAALGTQAGILDMRLQDRDIERSMEGPTDAASMETLEALDAKLRTLQAELRRAQEQSKRDASDANAHHKELTRLWQGLRDEVVEHGEGLSTLNEGLTAQHARLSSLRGHFDSLSQEQGRYLDMLESVESRFQERIRDLGEGRLLEIESRMEARVAEFQEALLRQNEELERLRGMPMLLTERFEGQLGSLQAELQAYRNQAAAFSQQVADRLNHLGPLVETLQGQLRSREEENALLREELGILSAQVSDRLNQLGPLVETLQGQLRSREEENARLRDELGALSARVSRIVQLLAKARPGA